MRSSSLSFHLSVRPMSYTHDKSRPCVSTPLCIVDWSEVSSPFLKAFPCKFDSGFPVYESFSSFPPHHREGLSTISYIFGSFLSFGLKNR